jgi:hypothetical protein
LAVDNLDVDISTVGNSDVEERTLLQNPFLQDNVFPVSDVGHFSESSFEHCRTAAQGCKSQVIIVEHCRTLSNTVEHCRTLSNTVEHCQTLLNIVEHCQTLSNIVENC